MADLESCLGTSDDPESIDFFPQVQTCLRKVEPSGTRNSFVLVIVTGGTIVMKNENGVYVPEKGEIDKVVESTPVLNDREFHHTLPQNLTTLGKVFVLPKLSKTERRVVYCLYEYEDFIDSCNMTIGEYKKIAEDIKKHYCEFDGFVILHGTDTMAYTASYLSFMLENLGKSVVLTGAQVPLCATRSDGVDNLLGALLIAGNYIIPEVTLFFHNVLHRGNRSRKMDSHSFSAFLSPNMDVLVRTGVDINVNWDIIWRSAGVKKFSVHVDMEENVGILRLFPGITAATVRAFLGPPMKGVVLQTYGTGNGPSNRKDVIDEIRKANERGVLLLNCTQCEVGCVTGAYQTGEVLKEAGVIPGYDTTPEAALAKLSYVVGQRALSTQDKRELLVENLRGEITKPVEKEAITKRNGFFEAVAYGMKLSTKSEREGLKDALFPPLLCFAARNDDIQSIDTLVVQGADIHSPDYDGRTCLHVSASHGNARTVEYLLSKGASVYPRDRFGSTPLEEAKRFKHEECIRLLMAAGAHVTHSAHSLLDDNGNE